MKNLLVVVFCCISFAAFSQHRIGVRAGLNYSKFNGPLEVNEEYDITGGFHFGINYTYEFNSAFGIRAELLYIQRGTGQKYFGKTNYIINPITPSSVNTFIEFGLVDMDVKISTAFLSIPITAQYRLTKKFELFAGVSLDFVVGPSGTGKVTFESEARPNDLAFTQSFDHKYGSDRAGEFNDFIRENLMLRLDGEIITLPKIVGAYYNFTTEEREKGNRLNGFDSHLIVGANYFINSGFYIGVRGEFGLLDITNNAVDYSIGELDSQNNYIFRDDKDTSFNLAVSFGFRF